MTKFLAIVALVAALFGATFASVSTADFARHLDREVHEIHCSLNPGAAPTSEESGCKVTMMSPYSSVLRTKYWGGIPVSLPGIGTFAFLAFWSAFLLTTRADSQRRAAVASAVWWTIPLITSVYMGNIAFNELGAACRMCIGIYVSSAVGWLASVAMIGLAKGAGAASARQEENASRGGSGEAVAATPLWWSIPVAGIFVALPVGAYVAGLPDYSEYEKGCGSLENPEDSYDVMVKLSDGPHEAVEVLDPLCAACRGFEDRLQASGLDKQLKRQVLLFPLDKSCNWMVSSSLHPGACAVSEAILCEPEIAAEILDWSFENQESIIAAEKAKEGAAAELVTEKFPATKRCVGSSDIRSKLHRGLRWAVQNELPVLTPQLFVEGEKLCNEDTDMGLEYMLTQMMKSSAGAQ